MLGLPLSNGFFLSSLWFPFVGVVADAASSESFFLEYQMLVEHTSALLCRFAKVEIDALAIAAVDQFVEEEVECTMRFSLLRRGDILRVDHLSSVENPCSSHRFFLLIIYKV